MTQEKEKEKEILQAIEENSLEQKEAKDQVAYHKKAAVDAESRLIAANIRASNLKEELRVYRITTPRYEETPRDREIAELREKLPELLKKIES